MTPVQVFYDGDCGLCRRTVRVLRRLDVLRQLEWVDFRAAIVDIDPRRLEHEMAARTGGRTYFGFPAYRALSWRLPIFWPLLPLMYLPGARPIGDAVYRRIAARRYSICEIDPRHMARRRPS
jgi:predicted DCC family thiol-disulfide oxidoreductase YuxK